MAVPPPFPGGSSGGLHLYIVVGLVPMLCLRSGLSGGRGKEALRQGQSEVGLGTRDCVAVAIAIMDVVRVVESNGSRWMVRDVM